MTLSTPPVELAERFNVAPTQQAPVVRASEADGWRADLLRWGLIPSWAREGGMGFGAGSGLVNARSETAATKPAFRSAFKTRRCLVPASGFFEWKAIQGERQKQPLYIRPVEEDDLFIFAGLWESWKPEDAAQPLETFAILTTAANQFMAPIHDRMPVILRPQDARLWLDAASTVHQLSELLKPFPSELMRQHPVASLVNSPKNDSPACIAPVEDAGFGMLF